MSVKVVKFGGSSLADANQFKKVYNIVKSDPERRYVIPSAPGKRFKDDTKVTDMLYNCYELASQGQDFSDCFEKIKQRYQDIISDLNLDLDLSQEFENIILAFSNAAGRDYAASRGEYLNGIILAKFLDYDFVDAAKCIRFKDNGSIDLDLTIEKTLKYLSQHERAVIPGFYGIMPNDTIKTFSRGGSDITGSLIARSINASVYENWTDVDGFLITDPKIVPYADLIDVITYKELRELSYMGATVLHEEAVFPVHQTGIPINVRNTNNPSCKGTLIVNQVNDVNTRPHITGIAGKKGFSIILIEKAMMNQELGFGRKVLQVLENFGISFEHLPSGIDTMSVVVESHYLKDKKDDVINTLYAKVNADNITIENNLALIAVVGRGMRSTYGTAKKITSAIANEKINIRMLDQGSSELNVIIGVDEFSFEAAVKAIYDEFYKTDKKEWKTFHSFVLFYKFYKY